MCAWQYSSPGAARRLQDGPRARQAAAQAPFDMPAAPVQLIGAAGSVGGGGAALGRGLGLFGSAHALAAGGLLRLQGVLFEDAKLTTIIFLCPRDPFVHDRTRCASARAGWRSPTV